MKQRKRIICALLALCMIISLFALTACGSTGKPSGPVDPGKDPGKQDDPKNPDEPKKQEDPVEKTNADKFEELTRSVKAAAEKSGYTLAVSRSYSGVVKYADEGDMDFDGKDFHEISVYAAGGKYNLVCLDIYNSSSFDEDACVEGRLQKDGVLYNYTKSDYNDSDIKWGQGVAEAGKSAMLREVPFLEIPAYRYVKNLKVDTVAGTSDILCYNGLDKVYTRYSFDVDSSYSCMLRDFGYNGDYTASNISIVDIVDEEGSLVACRWTFDEHWIDTDTVFDLSNVTDCEIKPLDTARPLTWFEDSSTYVRPVYADVTEIAREYFCNVPGKIIMDVRIPYIIESFPGAAMINNEISEKYQYELTETEETLAQQDFDGYRWLLRDYTVHRFGSIYEVCIEVTDGSAYGDETVSKIDVYTYDVLAGKTLTDEEFLTAMGYTMEDFLECASRIGWGDGDESNITDVFTPEELLDFYYFEDDGEPQFIIPATLTQEDD